MEDKFSKACLKNLKKKKNFICRRPLQIGRTRPGSLAAIAINFEHG